MSCAFTCELKIVILLSKRNFFAKNTSVCKNVAREIYQPALFIICSIAMNSYHASTFANARLKFFDLRATLRPFSNVVDAKMQNPKVNMLFIFAYNFPYVFFKIL